MKKFFATAFATITLAGGLCAFTACGESSKLRQTSIYDPIVGNWYYEQIADESITQTLYQIEYQKGNASRYYITVCTLKHDRKADADYDTPTRTAVTERKASIHVKKNDLYDFNVGDDVWVNIPDGQYEYRGPLFAPVDRDMTWFLVLNDDSTMFTLYMGTRPSGGAADYKNQSGVGAIANTVSSGYSFKKIYGSMSIEKFKSQTQKRDAGGNKMYKTDPTTGLYVDENGEPLADQNATSKWLPIWNWQDVTVKI